MTVINTTEITPIDRRFSTIARQAAKLLDVEIGDLVQKAHAIYDASQHYVEIYDVPAAGMMVLSANNELMQAAHVTDDFSISFNPLDERNAFDENTYAAGITHSSDLNGDYSRKLEYNRLYRDAA